MIIIIIVVLLLMGFGAYFYLYNGVSAAARKNGWNNLRIKEFSNSLYNKTKDSKDMNPITKFIIEHCNVNSVTNCVAKSVSENVKYDTVYKEDIQKIYRKIGFSPLVNCLSDCVEQKGKWESDFKKIFMDMFNDD